jgi:2-polyprenyl-6-methoxyphenol hydroxylase-like FAD-dependent oxidoreductase
VEFGRALVEIDRSGAATVVVRFANGAHEQGDVLIACDGIRSMARQPALPDAPEPAYSGLLDFGGIADCAVPIPTGVNVMVFGRRAFFGAFKTPTGQTWWFHNSGRKRPDAALRAPDVLRAHVLELHRNDPAWMRKVVESTERLPGPFPLNDILSMPRWYDGGARGNPGRGPGSVPCPRRCNGPGTVHPRHRRARAGVRDVERARRQRVEAFVKQSRRNGAGKAVSNPFGEWVRDRVLPFFLRLGTKAQERQYAYRVDWMQRYA